MALLQFDIVDKLLVLNQQWLASNKTTVDKTTLNDTYALGDTLAGAAKDSRAAFVRNALTCGGAFFLFCASYDHRSYSFGFYSLVLVVLFVFHAERNLVAFCVAQDSDAPAAVCDSYADFWGGHSIPGAYGRDPSFEFGIGVWRT